MARRVVLGERANGDYGLFVSSASQDANSSNDLTFDSNAIFTHGLFAYGQGSVSTRTALTNSSPKQLYTAEGTSGGQNDRIAHSLNYEPQVFLRWCYSDELFSNPSGYPSGTYGVTTTTPGRISSFTGGSLGGTNNRMNNSIGYGIDFEVDDTYLYISNYESGFIGLAAANGSLETKFTGLTIFYAYIITTAPNNGLKL
jgi:hypothetical protein